MKFGHEFKARLLQDGFPPHWVDAAISYSQLKKCIKRVESELSILGLDTATLQLLLKTVEQQNGRLQKADGNSADAQAPEAVQYKLSSGNPGAIFHPKLLFAVDEATGEPIDARLAPETRNYLHKIALAEQLTDVKITEDADQESLFTISTNDSASIDGENVPPDQHVKKTDRLRSQSRSYKMVEVPLTSDSQFFNMLVSELSGLATLQQMEQDRLNSMVKHIGTTVAKVTQPDRHVAKNDLARWRRIFEIYLDNRIFFATNEQDHGAHDAAKAQGNLVKFQKQIADEQISQHFKRKESAVAFADFMRINAELLKMLQFQEINRTAMVKILKKFDKRTSLNVQTIFPRAINMPALSENVAKAVCYQVTSDLLTVVPALDDYLCPICFNISYKPIRLRCQHVFCIRCLIVMQREKKDHCPLCRGEVVMEADSGNIDISLANFLVKFFPEEVKAKQKDNERLAGVDLYGEAFDRSCCVM
jgi:E3 ubiquitin-protein ligase BAH